MASSSKSAAARPDAAAPSGATRATRAAKPAKPSKATQSAASDQPAAQAKRPTPTKPAVKTTVKPTVTSPARPAAKPAKAADKPTQAAPKAGKSGGKAGKASDKPAKPPKLRQKLVRDSFTMPEADFSLIATLKARAMAAQRETKKSELLRAGLHALAGLDAPALLAALQQLEPVKIGRPKAH